MRDGATVWFPRARTVELRREPVAAPGPGELRIRAVASGLSHGTEMLVYRGQVPAGLDLDLPTLRGSYDFPIAFGYASVGRVEDVGTDVRGFERDDLVFTLHPHSSRYTVAAELVTLLPDGVEPEVGVFLANLETAITGVLDAAPRLGETVLLFGQGVVGLLMTALLHAMNVHRIITVEPSPLRADLSRALGTHLVLAPGGDLVERVHAATEGRGADVVIEASGNAAALNAAIESVAFAGTVVVTSWYGNKPATLALGGHFHRGRVRIVSSQVGSIDPALEPRWTRARRLALARELLTTLPLERLVTHRIPLEDAAAAYDLVDRRADQTAQVILTYGGDDV